MRFEFSVSRKDRRFPFELRKNDADISKRIVMWAECRESLRQAAALRLHHRTANHAEVRRLPGTAPAAAAA
jgi:hypothetical protein